MKKEVILFLCSYLLVTLQPAISWGSSNKDRVRLADISSITLEAGRMTNGRRSSPVPQLKCVGGSAGHSASQPRIVQCYNRGSDGYDVQWECKADMDNDYRFGRLQVSCEGYDNPDDPYVLKGSCGLEYELDLTDQGRNNRNQGGGGGGFYDNYHGNQGSSYQHQDSGGIRWGKIISLVILGTVVYWLYKCCSGGGRRYTPTSTADYSSTGTGTSSGSTGGGGGGFWTGAATGGLLGYMFGNRGTGYGGGWGRSYGPSWGSGYTTRTPRSSGWSSGGGWGGSRSSSRSSGSRTTSGFGGTSRR